MCQLSTGDALRRRCCSGNRSKASQIDIAARPSRNEPDGGGRTMSPRVGDVSAENNAEIESTRHSPEGYIVPLWRRRYRHMMAMHLLQSGVDITVVALWLGRKTPQRRICTSKRTHHEGAGIDEAPARRWLARALSSVPRADGPPPGALIMLRYRRGCAQQAASTAIPAHNPEMRKIDVCGIVINCAGQRKTRRG
jgi:hypothetical protein